MTLSRENLLFQNSVFRTIVTLQSLVLVVVLVLMLMTTSSDGFVLEVVGYQNKSHFHVLGSDSQRDPNFLGPRFKIIDVPAYTYPRNMECPEGQRSDGTGRCRQVWP